NDGGDKEIGDSDANAPKDAFENEISGGDQIEPSYGPMQHEDLDDNGQDVISGDQIDIDEGSNEIGVCGANTPKGSSETVEVEKRRRSTRIVSKPLKYVDYVTQSDGKGEPSVKKRRTESMDKKNKIVPQKRGPSLKADSQSQKVKMDNENSKDNDTGRKKLKCPECEFDTRCVSTWISHLRDKHSTTPALAGCLLRCDCGYESYSKGHSYEVKV
ncbi:hypothetical protein PMAYCL1PPCAC_20796, partial [Pristionchus mayeri]